MQLLTQLLTSLPTLPTSYNNLTPALAATVAPLAIATVYYVKKQKGKALLNSKLKLLKRLLYSRKKKGSKIPKFLMAILIVVGFLVAWQLLGLLLGLVLGKALGGIVALLLLLLLLIVYTINKSNK